jgi:hypothetical protein
MDCVVVENPERLCPVVVACLKIIVRDSKSCVDLSYSMTLCRARRRSTSFVPLKGGGIQSPLYALPVTTDPAHVCADLRSRLREGTTICALARDASLGLNKSSSVMLPAIALAALASRSTSSIIVER